MEKITKQAKINSDSSKVWKYTNPNFSIIDAENESLIETQKYGCQLI